MFKLLANALNYCLFQITTWLFNSPKAELPQVGILFRTQFPSLGIFIDKKVGF